MARRHFQTGCLTKKGKSWVFRYREYQLQADGSQKAIRKSVAFGQVSWPEAVRLRDDFVRHHGLRERTRPKAGMTVKEFWTLHFEPHILQKKRRSTQKMYLSLYHKHIEGVFGSEKLCDIERYGIQEFISWKEREGLSPQTLAHLRDVLSKMFGTAVLWGWLDQNPSRGVTMPQMVRMRKARVLTLEEISRLEVNLRDPARTLFALGIRLGLRIGELLGLKLEDVDLLSGTLYVRRSVCRGEAGPTKTPGSERRFPLPEQTVAILRDYLARREVPSEWLFPTMKGTFHNDRTLFMRYVAPVIKRLGMKHFSWHSMRHTFLTFIGNQGVAMPIAQSLAGHTNLRTTLGYIETFADEKRSALEGWEKKLQASASPRTTLRVSSTLVQ
jgi:integrase